VAINWAINNAGGSNGGDRFARRMVKPPSSSIDWGSVFLGHLHFAGVVKSLVVVLERAATGGIARWDVAAAAYGGVAAHFYEHAVLVFGFDCDTSIVPPAAAGLVYVGGLSVGVVHPALNGGGGVWRCRRAMVGRLARPASAFVAADWGWRRRDQALTCE
jgi:hypothetical protein